MGCDWGCFKGKDPKAAVYDPADKDAPQSAAKQPVQATTSTSPDTVIGATPAEDKCKSATTKDAPPAAPSFMSPVVQPPNFMSPGSAFPAGSGGHAPKPAAKPAPVRGAWARNMAQ